MECSGLEKILWKKYNCPYVFLKDHFEGTSPLFPCQNSSTDDKYLLPEAALGVDEKTTEETADQNFSNAKFLKTDDAHTRMTRPFLLLFGLLEGFLMYLMISSVGTKHNGHKFTRTGNLQPSATIGENLRSITRQMRSQAQVMPVR